jgi:thiol-disulfide isomerase/thioredoxin
MTEARRLLVACLCAEWCGSCRDYRATFDALSAQFSGQADFAWIDIEDESDALGDPDIENSRPCFSPTPAACASSAP